MNKDNKVQKKEPEKPDHYFYCKKCIEATKYSKEPKIPVLCRLPLHVYRKNKPAVLIGYVDKCPECQDCVRFQWIPNTEYSSEETFNKFIEANRGNYTGSLSEAELCSPKQFNIKGDESFRSYVYRFCRLLKQYSGEIQI